MNLVPSGRTLRAWGVGAAVGAVAGLAVALPIGSGHHREAPPPPGDRAAAAISAVIKDPVHLYVAPDVADMFTGAQLKEMRRDQRSNPVPGWVIVWGASGQTRADGAASDQQVLAQLEAALHRQRGFYAVITPTGAVGDAIGFEDPYVGHSTGSPASRMVGDVMMVENSPSDTDPQYGDFDDQVESEWGGRATGALTGAGIALAAYAATFGVVGGIGMLVRRSRMQQRGARRA